MTPASSPDRVPWYQVALTRRWLSYLLVTALFAGTCVALSMWQFSRREDARLEIERVLTNYESPALPLAEVLPSLDSFSENDKWKPIVVTGVYLPEEQLIVRSRPREQQAGVEVLTPLLTDTGQVFIVDRGWLPANENSTDPYVFPDPPSGKVTVVARLKASESKIPGRDMVGNQVATVELPLIQDVLGKPTYTGAYGLLESEDPPPIETAPLPALKPSLDEGAHLSYALQWIMFGVLAFIGLVWAVRNEIRIKNQDTDESKKATETKAKRRKSQPTEEDIEDAILDGRN